MVAINYNETLSKFGTILDGEQQRVKFNHLQTRYRARFIGLGVNTEGDNLTMSMQKFDTPHGAFENKSIELVNGKVNYPGPWTWDALSFTVYNTYDNVCYKALYNQIQRQRNISEQTTGDSPNNYKFTSIFEHTDGHQNVLSYWVMEGCYLLKAQSSGGTNGTYDSMMIDCSMQFDNATLYNADGTLIPTTDAGVISDATEAFAF